MSVGDEADFSQAILKEAKQEAEEIVDLARREAERILDGAREELNQIYIAESPQTQKQQATIRYNQIIAAAELESRRQILLTQERFIQEVQDHARTKLSQIREDDRYVDFLIKSIRQGLAELEGESFEIIIDPQDRSLLTQDVLRNIQKDTGKTVTLSADTQAGITGAIVRRTDKRAVCDNSFQAVLTREQPSIRLLTAQELFGEVEE